MLNYQRVFDVLMVEGMGLNLHTDHWISSIPQQNLAVSVIPSKSLFNGVGAFQVETTRSQLQLPVTIFHQTDQRAPSNKHEKNVFLPETLWQMIKLYYTIWYYIIYIYYYNIIAIDNNQFWQIIEANGPSFCYRISTHRPQTGLAPESPGDDRDIFARPSIRWEIRRWLQYCTYSLNIIDNWDDNWDNWCLNLDGLDERTWESVIFDWDHW